MRFMSGRLGSQGARAGARTATRTRVATTTAPAQASWLRRKVRQNCLSSPRRAARRRLRRILAAPPPPPREADAWIHHAGGKIGEEIGQKGEGGHDDEIAHDDGIVAGEDRL